MFSRVESYLYSFVPTGFKAPMPNILPLGLGVIMFKLPYNNSHLKKILTKFLNFYFYIAKHVRINIYIYILCTFIIVKLLYLYTFILLTVQYYFFLLIDKFVTKISSNFIQFLSVLVGLFIQLLVGGGFVTRYCDIINSLFLLLFLTLSNSKRYIKFRNRLTANILRKAYQKMFIKLFHYEFILDI